LNRAPASGEVAAEPKLAKHHDLAALQVHRQDNDDAADPHDIALKIGPVERDAVAGSSKPVAHVVH